MSNTRPRVLFIYYNGLIEPLGRNQIIPYLRLLAENYQMVVLSFEKEVRSLEEDSEERKQVESYLLRYGVKWIRLRYHKRPSLPASLYDIAHGIQRAAYEHSRERIALIHARGYVPGAIAWGLKRLLGIPYLFDIRGIQAEEYVDAGHWDPRGIRFKLTKRAESWVLHVADGIVTLTDAIRPILCELPGLLSRPVLPPWEVIPCCVDLDHFCFREKGRKRVRAELGVDNRLVLVYAGSVGTWYLLDEMLDFYIVARQSWPELFFLILANASHEVVRAGLRRHGLVEGENVTVRRVRSEEMPAYLSASDAGIAFIRPCLSKRSSSPTKYAEYLACGLPIVVNTGIGDVDALFEQESAGLLVRSFDNKAYLQAAEGLYHQLGQSREVFRKIAEKHFSLSDRALPAYRDIYERILAC